MSRLATNCFFQHRCMIVAIFLIAIFCSAAESAEATKVLGIVEDFRTTPLGPFQKGHLESWRWSDEFRQRARQWSSLEVITEGSGRALHVRVKDPQVFSGEAKSILRLTPFFPPEADVLRLRIKVLAGHVSLFVGGPTAYYGNSDVFTEPQTIRADSVPRSVDVDFNLNHPLWRNFRRAGYSADAQRNYYNRWAQEPTGVFLDSDSFGEFLLERVELVAIGEGKPFASFPPDQVEQVRSIATFDDAKLDQAFTLYMAAAESEWFDESWIRKKPLRFEPMALSIVDAGLNRQRSLQCRGRTAEEVHCAGWRTEGVANANAISATLRVDAPDQKNILVGTGPIVPVDFLVLTAPKDRPFPWNQFAASNELRSHGHRGFDFNFTHRDLARFPATDFAIYQTRRYLRPGEWTALVLPVADFVGIYGHGAMRERFVSHEPLRSDEVIAVAWLNPWCRVGRRDEPLTTLIDTLAFVRVPGLPADHRSFWQIPDVKLQRRLDETSSGIRKRHFWNPGDSAPPKQPK